jgi:hypothetical protein
MDARQLHAHHQGLEKGLWTTEGLAADFDDLTVRELVGHSLVTRFLALLELGLVVQSHVAVPLLDIFDNFVF